MNHRRSFLAGAGATLLTATAHPKPAAAGTGDRRKDVLYLHGMAWNTALPGLAGQLLLTFDVEADLGTGTGFGTASDSVHPEANFQFALTTARKAGNDFELVGSVIRATNPSNVGLPVRVLAEMHGEATRATVQLGSLTFRGAGSGPRALTDPE